MTTPIAEDTSIRQMNEKPGTEFMAFWKTVNSILSACGQPEMLYGEARGYFYDYREARSILGVF